jgi:hypothetical protein
LALNVAKVDAYATVVVKGISTLLSIGAIATAIGAGAVPIIQAGAAALTQAIAAWDKASNGSATVSIDTGSFSALFTSILTDAENVFSQAQTAVTAVTTTVSTGTTNALTTANTLLGAAETAVALLQSLVAVGAPYKARVGAVLAVPKMSEAQMFAAVHMKAP